MKHSEGGLIVTKTYTNLIVQSTVKILSGFLLMGALLFLSAGTWLFMGLLFFPMLLLGITLFFKNKAVLETFKIAIALIDKEMGSQHG